MDVSSVLASLRKMFPNPKLNEAVQAAQEAISGTPNSLDGARATAQKFGITSQAVNEIYSKYGNTMQGRLVCSILGTTPEALKADADMIVGGGQSTFKPPQNAKQSGSRFPRLK